jgi:hypothetical protein
VNPLVEQLAAVLGEMERRYRGLGEAETFRNSAIRRYDREAMAEADRRCGAISREIEALDARRRDVAAKLGTELGLPGSIRRPPRLVQLAERLAEPDRSRLLGLHGVLRQRIEAVQKLAGVNAAVTEKMLRHCHRLMSIIAGGGVAHKTYGSTGRLSPAANARLVNQLA